MKQKRDNNKFDKISFSLRYSLNLKYVSDKVIKVLNDNNVIHEFYLPDKENKMNYVIIVDNLDTRPINPLILKKMNKKLKIEDKFDFFLGIISDYEMGGFTVPDVVVDYIRVLGGKVEFSYIT